MSVSMHQASVVGLGRALGNLKNILQIAAEHAIANKIDPAVLINMRLFPDMYPLERQVHIASDLASRCVARLAQLELPESEETEQTFDSLITRVENALSYVGGIDPEKIDDTGEMEIVFQGGGREVKTTARGYLFDFILPNVYFHITTAYNILRHCGVKLGKKDYTGTV